MKVIDHEPHAWFLLEEEGALFLDANCSHSAFGYDFMIQMTREEVAAYRGQGRSYVTALAQRIQDSAPILERSTSVYKGRDVAQRYSDKVTHAILAWRAADDTTIMSFEAYEDLPDYLEPGVVWELTERALRESAGEEVRLTLFKLDALSDRQWHTYKLAPETLRENLRTWLIKHWQPQSEFYLEMLLGLAYCYALDKGIYVQALEQYQGRDKCEFERHLEKSAGENIDPWWSMRAGEVGQMP